MNLCVHGKPLHRPDLCAKCWELARALGLVEETSPDTTTAGREES